VIVALADQPLLNAQDITDLISAFKKRPEGSQVVFPRVNGDRGNPVIFTQEVREQILHSGLQVGCRQWQSTHPELVTPFETDNRRYQVDLDTEDDIVRFERETGHRLRWPAIA